MGERLRLPGFHTLSNHGSGGVRVGNGGATIWTEVSEFSHTHVEPVLSSGGVWVGKLHSYAYIIIIHILPIWEPHSNTNLFYMSILYVTDNQTDSGHTVRVRSQPPVYGARTDGCSNLYREHRLYQLNLAQSFHICIRGLTAYSYSSKSCTESTPPPVSIVIQYHHSWWYDSYRTVICPCTVPHSAYDTRS